MPLLPIIGPVLGGLFAGIGLWRFIFFINIPLAILTIVIIVKNLPENRDESAKKQDIIRCCFSSSGTVIGNNLRISGSIRKRFFRHAYSIIIGSRNCGTGIVSFCGKEKRSSHDAVEVI